MVIEMSLLIDFEELCKYVRECTGDDIVCGFCEYDAGTVGEEPIECPGFESNECFVLKESLRKQYEMYDQVIRCKDCVFWGIRIDTLKRGYCRKYDHTARGKDYCAWGEKK